MEEEIKDKLELQTEKEFCKQEKDVLSVAKTFVHRFNNKKRDPIHWNILAAGDDIDDDDAFVSTLLIS